MLVGVATAVGMAALACTGHVVDGRAEVEEGVVLLEAQLPVAVAAVEVVAVELLAALLLASWVK